MAGAIGITFLLSGLVFSTLVARLPALRAGLDLTDGQLAVALVALNGGAVVGLQAGAALVRRFGSRAALRVALPGFAAVLPPIALAPSLPALAGALAVSAAVNSVVDVAINANGVTVERRSGRTLLSRLHAMLTLGGMLGAGLGAVAAATGMGATAHFALVAAAVVAGALATGGHLAPDEPNPRDPRNGRASGKHWALGALAFCVMLAEGGGNDWTAVYLHDTGAGDAGAAAGVAVFLGAMTVGRLAGDRIRRAVDAGPLVAASALVAAVGLGLALLLHRPAAGLAGFGLLGLGLSVTLPVIFGVAARRALDSGGSPAVAVARVSTLAYLGSFTGPALIGALAAGVGLRVALLLPVAALAAAAIAATSLRRQ